MKTAEEVKPNYAPIYAACLYPKLAQIFVKHGYALAVHGSLAKDFDIIGVPWADKISNPDEVLKEITETFAIEVLGSDGKIYPYHEKNHGRICYTILIKFGDCHLDLSFFPFST